MPYKDKKHMLAEWISDKLWLLYVLGAAIVIGIIWLIGECRLLRRTRTERRKKKKVKLHISKYNKE